jgi:hypothetical protein
MNITGDKIHMDCPKKVHDLFPNDSCRQEVLQQFKDSLHREVHLDQQVIFFFIYPVEGAWSSVTLPE